VDHIQGCDAVASKNKKEEMAPRTNYFALKQSIMIGDGQLEHVPTKSD